MIVLEALDGNLESANVQTTYASIKLGDDDTADVINCRGVEAA